MPVKFSELKPEMQRFLTIYPVRNRVKWLKTDGKIVLIYPKDFSKYESWLQKRIGGPTDIRRPLDELGTKVWLMCDGKHTLKDICVELDAQYKEEVEPVLDRVWKFLELLLRSNLVRLSDSRVYPKKLRAIKKE